MSLILREQVRRNVVPYVPDYRSQMSLALARYLYNNSGALAGSVFGAGSRLVEMIRSQFKSGSKKRRKAVRTQDTSTMIKSITESVPVAINNFFHNPTHFKFDTNCQNLGIEGVRLVGRQFWAVAQSGAANDYMFAGVGAFALSPDVIGGRCALIARTYAKYAFRYFRLIFMTNAPTSQAGSMSLAIVNDPDIDTFAVSNYQTIMQCVPMVNFPSRTNGMLDYHYTGPDTWFSEFVSTTASDERFTAQALVYGLGDGTASQRNVVVGNFVIEYIIDCYQPVQDLGFTLSAKTPSQIKELKELKKRFESEDQDRKIDNQKQDHLQTSENDFIILRSR